MTQDSQDSQGQFGRRTVAKGAAWAVPAVVVAATAPAYATSLQKVPGINGWVGTTHTNLGDCRHRLTFDSTINATGPDGAPYGLYLYDTTPGQVVTNAQMVIWLRTSNTDATWTRRSGHSDDCWGVTPDKGAPQTIDGKSYTPYAWTYTCPISTNNPVNNRVFLQNFNVSGTFTLNNSNTSGAGNTICNDVCFWAQRNVTIDGALQSFRRRRGYSQCSEGNKDEVPGTEGGRMRSSGAFSGEAV